MFKRATVLLSILCLTSGCAAVSTSRFRIVDARTGRPLEGVQAERLGFIMEPAMPGLIPVRIPTALESVTSDSSGSVEFREKGAEFALHKDGYEYTRITGTSSGFKVKDSDDREYLPLYEDGAVHVALRRSGYN